MQAAHRLIDGDQRTTAGGVDRDAGPLETKGVANATNASAVGKPGALKALDNVIVVELGQKRVVRSHDAHKDANVGVLQWRRRHTSIFHRPVGVLHQHSMLRIDPASFLIRNVKERCIKVGDVVQESALSRIHFSRFTILTVKVIDIPTVVWNIAHRIDTVEQVLPEFMDVACARKTAAHSDDCNVLTFHHRFGGRRFFHACCRRFARLIAALGLYQF